MGNGRIRGKMLGGWRLMLVVQRQPPGSSELPLNDQHPGPQPPAPWLGGIGKVLSPAGLPLLLSRQLLQSFLSLPNIFLFLCLVGWTWLLPGFMPWFNTQSLRLPNPCSRAICDWPILIRCPTGIPRHPGPFCCARLKSLLQSQLVSAFPPSQSCLSVSHRWHFPINLLCAALHHLSIYLQFKILQPCRLCPHRLSLGSILRAVVTYLSGKCFLGKRGGSKHHSTSADSGRLSGTTALGWENLGALGSATGELCDLAS